jgi:hypothetical protein
VRALARSRDALRTLFAVTLATASAACGAGGSSRTDASSTERLRLKQQALVLGESLRVARDENARQHLEKDLLVREVHSFDYFMQQLESELRKIHSLERAAGALNPRLDPLNAMDSERARILEATRAARSRLALLEADAEAQGRQLTELRDSVRASTNNAAVADSTRDSSRSALVGVQVLVRDLRARIDGLQRQVDSLARTGKALHQENVRLAETIAQTAARDSTVFYVVGTRRQLLAWKVVREDGGMKVTGWGRVLRLSDQRDSSRFRMTHMRDLTLDLDERRSYQILSTQRLAALETRVSPDGVFRGNLRIRDPGAFWGDSKWLVLLAR